MADEKTAAHELRALRGAMLELGIDTGTIVTWDEEGEPETGIRLVPFRKWLLEE